MAKSKKRNKKINLRQKHLVTAVCIAVAAAIIISAISMSFGKRQHTLYDFNTPTAQGIDVSEHNKDVDWQKVKEEFDFAFIRIGYRGYTEGGIMPDERAKENLKGAKSAGVPVGVYFYTQAVNEKEAEEEADFLLSRIRHYDISLPVIIDFEYAFDKDGNHAGRLFEANLSPDEKAKVINAFLNKVKKKGYTYGVYASSSVLKNEINMSAVDKNAVIWVADYNEKVTYDVDYTIWQYSKTGKSDAVGSKYVDLNYWYD